MKTLTASAFTSLILLIIFGAVTGCRKVQTCETWQYNRLITDVQPGCATMRSEYGLREQVCGDALRDAHNNSTVIESKNECFTSRIQYVKRVN